MHARSEGSAQVVPMHRFADGALLANLMLYAKYIVDICIMKIMC